jgi:superfamily I DNA/RNA helicase
MTAPNPDPNLRQRDLIESTGGLHLVDAGAGTGKTFTVTRRYATIVDGEEIEPEDVLLVTFTNNAATEMRDRIVARSEYGVRELAEAPIQTFHSLCHDLLTEHGFEAPTLLGIDDRITDSTRLIENETVEETLFREFIRRFGDEHPEYDDFFRAVTDPTELLGLINRLAAKGVFPTIEGWYRRGERHLDGEYEAFETVFEELNRPRNGGSKQSRLRERLGGYGGGKCYRPDAPEKAALRGQGTKQVPPEIARRVFEEDREALESFVHDVYYEYLAFALGRNYLNFGFLQLFAYVLLCEDHRLRETVAFEYLMIDEFQDSSEIQFKLALLLAGTNNLCVVGDWKQSIYSFQYAAVENITEFESRLDRFIEELNDDHERVSFPTRPITEVELTESYRSTQAILDVSEESLLTPASGSEEVDSEALKQRIVSLSSNATHENSRIEAIRHENEHEAVLTKIQEIVRNEDYRIEADAENEAENESEGGGARRAMLSEPPSTATSPFLPGRVSSAANCCRLRRSMTSRWPTRVASNCSGRTRRSCCSPGFGSSNRTPIAGGRSCSKRRAIRWTKSSISSKARNIPRQCGRSDPSWRGRTRSVGSPTACSRGTATTGPTPRSCWGRYSRFTTPRR